MSASDGELIAASIDQPVRFAAIFDRHIDPVRRFVTRRLGAGRADDVVGEVFRVAFERRASFDASVTSTPRPNASTSRPACSRSRTTIVTCCSSSPGSS